MLSVSFIMQRHILLKMNCMNILKNGLLPLACFVPITHCMYWNTSPVRMDINTDHVGGYTAARSVQSCARFCNKPLQLFLFFYFSQVTQECYCSERREAFSEDLSKEEAILGEIKPVKDCLDYHLNGYLFDDYFIIEPRLDFPVTVWCDMKNGGWTNIQRRLDGSVDFNRNWTEYARGFGDPDGEMWLGLDNIHTLTKEPSELYIYLETFGDVSPVDGYAWYSDISVADESLKYRLTLSLEGYKGTVPSGITIPANGLYFSSYDRDNDVWHNNCAATFKGGWWFGDCHAAHLNGYYHGGQHGLFGHGILWATSWGYYYSLKADTMKVRRVIN